MVAGYQFAALAQYHLLQLTDCHLVADPDGDYQQIRPYRHLQRLLQHVRQHYLSVPVSVGPASVGPVSVGKAQPLRPTLRQPLTAVILTGDLTQDHSLASYMLLADLLKDWPTPVFYLPGNHDDRELMAQAFARPPFQPESCLAGSGWQWLLLDSKGPTPAGSFDQQRCLNLQQQLDQAPAAVWLFCHHHPVPIGAAIDRDGWQQPELLLQLLQHYPKVKGLAHGHCHDAYQRTLTTPPLQLVGCPATSVQFRRSSDWLTEDQGPQACLWTFTAKGEVLWEFIRC